MKKKIIIALLLLFTFNVFALMDNDNPLAEARNRTSELQGWFNFSQVGVEVSVSPDWIIFEGEKIPASEFRLDKNGYYYIKDNIVIFDQFHHLLCWHNTTLDFHPVAGETVSYGYSADYTQSSFLTETLGSKKISYDAQNLNTISRKPGIINDDYYVGNIIENYEQFFIWNEDHKPWVTQKVGESVTANLDGVSNAVSLLNGYVDPYHPDYYKKNARIKDFKITDDKGNEYFFTLKDEASIQTFMLDSNANIVTLTVLSVYPGEKYNDICLSMFAGVYAYTHINNIIVQELEAAKHDAEFAYEIYLSYLEDYPDNIIYDRGSLIRHEWEMYYMIVEDRIQKEFGGKYEEHDIEIYNSPDLKIHLAVNHHNIVTVFYAKEKITKYGFKFKTLPGSRIEPFEDDKHEYDLEKEKDGWIISAFYFGADDTYALPLSAHYKLMTESGKIREVDISKDGLKAVKRFGELLIGASDLK